MADLVTLPDLKAYLRLEAVRDDALLARMITGYSRAVESWLSRKIAQTSVTERRDGNGKSTLIFAEWPVSAVSSVTVDGVAVPAATTPFSPNHSGYSFTEHRLYLVGSVFALGVGNVALAYTAGYATIPDDLQEIVLRLVAQRYKDLAHLDEQARAMAGETTTYDVKDFPSITKTILNQHRKTITV